MKSPFNLKGSYNSIFGLIVGTIIATVLIGYFLIQPSWKGLQTVNAELPTEQAKEAQVKADQESLNKAKDFFQNQRDDAEKVATAVPTQPNIPAILSILESLSRSNNVFLTSFAPQQVPTGAAGTGAGAGAAANRSDAGTPSGVNSVEITANYRGEYASLINFFFALENSLRIVDVKSLNVNSNKQAGIEGNITFRAYYKSVTATPGAAATDGVTP